VAKTTNDGRKPHAWRILTSKPSLEESRAAVENNHTTHFVLKKMISDGF
jgi:hypothetical protein